MKKLLKIMALVLVVVLAIGVLVACNDETADPTPGPDNGDGGTTDPGDGGTTDPGDDDDDDDDDTGSANTRLTVTFMYVDPQGNPMYVQGEDNVSSRDVKVNWGKEGKNTILGNVTAFENYVITGWDTDGDGVADDGLKAVKKNMVVYSVVREKVEFDVTLLKVDGTEFAKIKVKEGNPVPRDNRPVEVGKYFEGWSLETENSESTADVIRDACSFKPTYGVADGTIGKVASGSITLDGIRDDAYNTSGAYLPVNTMTQADGRYSEIKDVDHGGKRAVPTATADTWIVWDGDYIYMIIEVSDLTATERNDAYTSKGLDAWANDGVELWYTFEQVLQTGYNDTRVGIDAMGKGTYALARSKGIGKGRSTHYDDIKYAVRNVLEVGNASDLSRTGYADDTKTTRKASYIIEYRIPAWTEGEADVANYPDINKDTGLLAGRNPDSNNKNDYAFTTGDKLVAGDFIRVSLQINDLMIAQKDKTGVAGSWFWDCPPADKIPETITTTYAMIYVTDGNGTITGDCDLVGLFSACGHTNNYTQYYIMFTLSDTAEAQTKIYGLSGHASGWEGADTRKFYTDKECTTEYTGRN